MPKQPVLYEAMYILDSALDEAGCQSIVQTLEEHIRAAGGEVVATHEFGRRRLAYEINHHTTGTYMITYFRGFGPAVDEVRRLLRVLDGVLRGMIVVANPQAIFDPHAAAAATAAPATEETAESETEEPKEAEEAWEASGKRAEAEPDAWERSEESETEETESAWEEPAEAGEGVDDENTEDEEA